MATCFHNKLHILDNRNGYIWILLISTYNRYYNTLIIYNVLVLASFASSKVGLDIYHNKLCIELPPTQRL